MPYPTYRILFLSPILAPVPNAADAAGFPARAAGGSCARPRRKRPCLYAQIRLLIVPDASKALFPVWGAGPFVLSYVFIKNSQQYPPALLAEIGPPCYNAAMEQDTPKR